MLSQKAKDLFGKLGCEIQPVAVKYCFARPAGVEHVDEKLDVRTISDTLYPAAAVDRLYCSGLIQPSDSFGLSSL